MKTIAVNTDKYQGHYFVPCPVSKTTDFEDIKGIQKDSCQANGTLPLDTITLPTYSNLEKITENLSEILSKFFDALGAPNTHVNISVDQYSNNIVISGQVEDSAQLEEILNKDEDIKDKILTVNTIASHVCQMPEHLAFQKEYFESDSPEQVLAKYSHLFNEEDSEQSISFKFSNGKLEIYYNGEAWNYK